MTNPQLGFAEMVQAQAQPHVVINAGDRAITAAMFGEIVIDIPADEDYVFQASDPLDPADEWPYGVIVMSDTGVVLTGPINVVYPDLDALYGGPSRPRFFLTNNTAQTLTVTTGTTGDAGVAVAAGETILLRYDGDGIVSGESGDSGPATAPVVTLAGDTYTLGDLTNGAWHEFTSATAVTLTLLDDATEPVAAAAEFGLMIAGAGGLTLVEDNDAVIVTPRGGTLVMEQGDFAVLKRRAADVYKLAGETTAA
jgi:hypothetical protein